MTEPSYLDFLRGKAASAPETGFDVPAEDLNPKLFPWQRDIVR